MLGIVALAFLLGCFIGAVLVDLAIWHRRRSPGQNLIEAVDSGFIFYGRRDRAELVAEDQNEQEERG